MSETPGTHVVYKDSVTGEFVTAEYAAEHPDTTYAETVPDEPTDPPQDPDPEPDPGPPLPEGWEPFPTGEDAYKYFRQYTLQMGHPEGTLTDSCIDELMTAVTMVDESTRTIQGLPVYVCAVCKTTFIPQGEPVIEIVFNGIFG